MAAFRQVSYALSGIFPYSRIYWTVTTPPVTVYAQVQNAGIDPVEEDWDEQTNEKALTKPILGSNVDGKILWLKQALETGSILDQLYVELSVEGFAGARQSSFFLMF